MPFVERPPLPGLQPMATGGQPATDYAATNSAIRTPSQVAPVGSGAYIPPPMITTPSSNPQMGPTYSWNFPTVSATPTVAPAGGGDGGGGGAPGGGKGPAQPQVPLYLQRIRQQLGLPAQPPPGSPWTPWMPSWTPGGGWTPPGAAQGRGGVGPGVQGAPGDRPGIGAPGIGGGSPVNRGSPGAPGPGGGANAPDDGGGAPGGGGNLGGGGYARGGQAEGGMSPESFEKAVERNTEHMFHSSGLIHSNVPGRTDKIKASVPPGSYIIPADVVSGEGEGNSLAGASVIDRLIHSGPYGTKPLPSRGGGGMGIPAPPGGRELPTLGEASHARGGRAGGGDIDPGEDPSSRMFWQHHQNPQATAWTRDKPPLSQRYLDPASYVRQNVELLPEASPQPAPTRPWSFAGGGEVDGQTSLSFPPMPRLPQGIPGIIPGGVAPQLAQTTRQPANDGDGTTISVSTRKRGGQDDQCKIIVAGGEYFVHPDDVTAYGGGDLGKGHDKLDKYVVDTRKRIAQKMLRLPGPKQ